MDLNQAKAMTDRELEKQVGRSEGLLCVAVQQNHGVH